MAERRGGAGDRPDETQGSGTSDSESARSAGSAGDKGVAGVGGGSGQPAGAGAGTGSAVPPRRFLRLKWKRRLLWALALAFGLGLFGLVYAVYRPRMGRSEQAPAAVVEARRRLAPVPAAQLLPLKEPWRKPVPQPFPEQRKAQPLPPPGVPLVALMGVEYLPAPELQDPEKVRANRALAKGLEGLLRRDLDLVEGLGMGDAALLPAEGQGPLQDRRDALRARLPGIEVALRVVLDHLGPKLRLRGEWLRLAEPGPPRETQMALLEDGSAVEGARVIVKSLAVDLAHGVSEKAWRRIGGYLPSQTLLQKSGLTLLAAPAGLSGDYETNPLLALAQIRTMNPGETANALRAAVSVDPECVEAHWRMERALAPNSGHEAGLGYCQNALTRSPHCGPARLGQARRLLRLGRLEESLAAGLQAVALLPNSAAAHANLARVYLGLNGVQAAQACARRALELDPLEGEGQEANVRALLAWDLRAEALQAAERFWKQAPGRADAFALLVRTLRQVGEHARAGRMLAQAPEGLRAGPLEALLKAEQLFWTGQLKAAQDLLNGLPEGVREREECQAILGRASALGACPGAVHNKQTEEGVAAFRVQAERAGPLWRKGDLEGLRGAVRGLEQMAPDDPEALRWRIRLYRQEGRQFELLPLLERLQATGWPQTLQDKEDLIEARVARAEFEKAEEVLAQQLPASAPRDRKRQLQARILLARGEFYSERLNDQPQALKAFNEALRMDNQPRHFETVLAFARAYMNLLVTVGKVSEAREVVPRLNGPLNRVQREHLEAALAQALRGLPAEARSRP